MANETPVASTQNVRSPLIRWAFVCLGVAFLAEWFGFFDWVEYKTYDWRVVRYTDKPAPVSSDIVIVAIDEKAEESLGASLGLRDVYLVALKALETAGCKGAYFAILFKDESPEPSPWTDVGLPIFVAQPYTKTVQEPKTGLKWVGEAPPLPSDIAAANPTTSYSVAVISPEDGIYRHSLALVNYGIGKEPKYSLEALFASEVLDVSPSALDMPLDPQGRLLLPRGRIDLPTVSFADVIVGPESIKDQLKGKWAVIGVTPPSTATEVDRVRASFGMSSALDLRVRVINALLTRHHAQPRTLRGIAFAFGLWSVALIALALWAQRTLPSAWSVALVAACAVLAHAVAAFCLFPYAWVPVVSPIVGLVAAAFAWMLSLNSARTRAAELRALQAEREAAFGVMTSQVRHEIRNLLNSIRAPAEMVQRNFSRGDPLGLGERPIEIASEMTVILDRVTRLSDMVENELSFFHPRSFRFERGDLWDLLIDARDTLSATLDENNVVTREDAPNSRRAVMLDPEKMRVVFVNLIRNAVQAMPKGGSLRLSYGERRARGRGRIVYVRVADSGPGMDPEQMEKLFEPFYTTKAQGLGLGLVSVKRVVETHGGEVKATSAKGHGAMFEVSLPAARS